MGGTTELWLNVTYNYYPVLSRPDILGEKGIELLREYLPQIEKECSPRKKQTDLNDQDIWPQRNPADGEINWRLTSRQIYDFIRAQTKPYPGAFTHYEGERYSIWEAEITRYSGPNRELAQFLIRMREKDRFLWHQETKQQQ